jgi:hypothetical protein
MSFSLTKEFINLMGALAHASVAQIYLICVAGTLIFLQKDIRERG